MDSAVDSGVDSRVNSVVTSALDFEDESKMDSGVVPSEKHCFCRVFEPILRTLKLTLWRILLKNTVFLEYFIGAFKAADSRKTLFFSSILAFDAKKH